MTEKKRSSKTSKLKTFLATGSIEEEGGRFVQEEGAREEPSELLTYDETGPPEMEEEVIVEDIVPAAKTAVPERTNSSPGSYSDADVGPLEKEIAELKRTVAGLASQLDKYTTSKEQLKENIAVMNRRDAELANTKYLRMLEQLSVMREDFFKLCNGMNAKLGSFSAKDILSSFEAYGVDMENILVDSGVQIGPSKYEKLNTIHQRIVGVIPTDDESMNGMIAERVSDKYEYQGRVLLKEKVKIYKFSENKKTEGDEEK
jgi:molecular chaperone GrpE (heat shock protein)